MPEILLSSGTIPYALKKSPRRRTIAVQVDRGGAVTVFAPAFAGDSVVERFLGQRADWILEKRRTAEGWMKSHPPREFVSGESFPLWGRDYRLKIVHAEGISEPECDLRDGRLHVMVNGTREDNLREAVQNAIRRWYTRQAEEKVQESLRRFAVRMGIAWTQVKVVDQKRRWASCSRQGHLRFNWRLAAMPPAILDYVVVHELAHLKAQDHSDRFWRIVKAALPDYEKRRARLRHMGVRISFSMV